MRHGGARAMAGNGFEMAASGHCHRGCGGLGQRPRCVRCYGLWFQQGQCEVLVSVQSSHPTAQMSAPRSPRGCVPRGCVPRGLGGGGAWAAGCGGGPAPSGPGRENVGPWGGRSVEGRVPNSVYNAWEPAAVRVCKEASPPCRRRRGAGAPQRGPTGGPTGPAEAAAVANILPHGGRPPCPSGESGSQGAPDCRCVIRRVRAAPGLGLTGSPQQRHRLPQHVQSPSGQGHQNEENFLPKAETASVSLPACSAAPPGRILENTLSPSAPGWPAGAPGVPPGLAPAFVPAGPGAGGG